MTIGQFQIAAPEATDVRLHLRNPDQILKMERGDPWTLSPSVTPETLYCFEVDGILMPDPYSRALAPYPWSPLNPDQSFDWQGDRRLRHERSFIYELHVGNFANTYLGVADKAPYLVSLGVTTVELLPVFTFLGDRNVWGYAPAHFFTPDSRYALDDPVREFKEMVRTLHSHGLEVILDVVYNHTGGPLPPTYYLRGPEGEPTNYSGCGNTLSPHHPLTQRLILESLRYWVTEMHVDGFRFDLASILTRDERGEPLSSPPLPHLIASDPALRGVRLIAEPWDAAGLYQVGEFPKWGPWQEWSGPFRDEVRKFLRGDGNLASFAEQLKGSPTSIHFITCHDGFTLRDLVSFNSKQNLDNGEENRDGADENFSWDCDGDTRLQERQISNFLLALFVSGGTAMLRSGDEIGESHGGNNNSWCQPRPFDWSQTPNPLISRLAALEPEAPLTYYTESLERPNWSRPAHFLAYTTRNHYIAFNASNRQIEPRLPPGRWEPLVDTGGSFPAMPPYSALLLKREG